MYAIAMEQIIITLRSIAIGLCPCVCLSVGEHVCLEPLERSSRNFVQIYCGRDSVLLRQRCDTLCTSGL